MKIITGMHRSGTSAAANLIRDLGLDFGPAGNLRPPNPFNPGGTFEHNEIALLNKRIIEGRWGRARYVALPSAESIFRRGMRLLPQVKSFAAQAESWVVKAPHFCLTLPIWKSVTQVDWIIFSLRHPEDTSDSIRQRYHTPRWLNLRLWDRHVADFLAAVGDTRLLVLDYDRLSGTEPGDELERLREFLELDTPVSAMRGILSRVYRREWHHNYSSNRTRLPASTAALHERLQFLRHRLGREM